MKIDVKVLIFFVFRFIPGIYRVNEMRMLQAYEKMREKPAEFAIHEYNKGDWTFHGKGAWFYEDKDSKLVDLTVIGSSNYSYRSNRRDTECQLYIVPQCNYLKKRLHDESQFLYD